MFNNNPRDRGNLAGVPVRDNYYNNGPTPAQFIDNMQDRCLFTRNNNNFQNVTQDNKIGFDNFNLLIDQYKDKVDADIKTKFLEAMAKGFYPDMPENLGKDFIANSIDKQGNVDYATTMREFVAMGHAYYKAKEGHDYIMIFNTDNGNYVTIDTADDMKKALEKGVLKTSGGMDFFDDRSKGTPQLLTGNI